MKRRRYLMTWQHNSTEAGVFTPGTLGQRLRQAATRALLSGALEPITTYSTCCQDGGIRFLIRLVAHLRDRPRGNEGHNPFLPYEQALHVADASDSHVCILNKYNVVDLHLLIITRAFEHQERLLDSRDFQALWRCLLEFESLGFYNSGRLSGASQLHKHLQVVPLPLIPGRGGGNPTLDMLLDTVAAPAGAITRISGLPFRHALVRWDAALPRDADQLGLATWTVYRLMLTQLGIPLPESPEALLRTPYNLLLTRRWMLLVPRERECFGSISLNALAFAGSLLAHDAAQLETLRRAGLWAALRSVAVKP